MEFLSLSRRCSSARNVPSGKERGETDVFAGYVSCPQDDFVKTSDDYVLVGNFKEEL